MRNIIVLLWFCCIVAANQAVARQIPCGVEDNTDTSTCTPQCMCDNITSPLGITGDHVHDKGGWMFGYSLMNMNMRGVGSGTHKLTEDQVYRTYMMAPANMQMQMHMLMFMYGFTDRLTLMGMAGFTLNNMNMNMEQGVSMPGMNMQAMPSSMNTMTSGIADSRVGLLYRLVGNGSTQLTGGLGVSIPTGSVVQNGITLMGDNQRLCYMMQTGSGSFGLAPGVTLTHSTKYLDFGVQFNSLVYLNKNSQGYRMGNSYQADVWASWLVRSFLSLSLRVNTMITGKITGEDAQVAIPMNESMDPTADAHNYGSATVNVYGGFNFRIPHPALKKFLFQAEFGLPCYRYVNGTQGLPQNTLLAGLKYSFR